MKREDFQQVRPWSEIEVAQAMTVMLDRLDDAISTLKALGVQKAESQSALDSHQAHWMLVAKVDHPDLKSDAMRSAWMIDQVDGTSELMLANDLNETLYKDQIAHIRAMQSQSEMLRSMMRSARDSVESWPEHRAAAAQREREGH